MKSRKRVENPQIEEFGCLKIKFRKDCEVRLSRVRHGKVELNFEIHRT
jgi:hypothetical protein